MGLFKGKSKTAKDEWGVATAMDNDRPLIIRVRYSMPDWCDKSKFAALMAFSWPFESESGMPDSDTNEAQMKLEDIIEQHFEPKLVAALAVVVTGNGVKEWQLYANDKDAFMALVNSTFPVNQPFPIQIECQDDPEWQGYATFRNQMK